jgi:hypothetical protein
VSVSGDGCNGREEAIEGGCQCTGGYGELNIQYQLMIHYILEDKSITSLFFAVSEIVDMIFHLLDVVIQELFRWTSNWIATNQLDSLFRSPSLTTTNRSTFMFWIFWNIKYKQASNNSGLCSLSSQSTILKCVEKVKAATLEIISDYLCYTNK